MNLYDSLSSYLRYLGALCFYLLQLRIGHEVATATIVLVAVPAPAGPTNAVRREQTL